MSIQSSFISLFDMIWAIWNEKKNKLKLRKIIRFVCLEKWRTHQSFLRKSHLYICYCRSKEGNPFVLWTTYLDLWVDVAVLVRFQAWFQMTMVLPWMFISFFHALKQSNCHGYLLFSQLFKLVILQTVMYLQGVL